MCQQCMSTAEQVVASAALVGVAVRAPLQRMLAQAGLVPEHDVARRDLRTVTFLRALELDPVEILGHDVVTEADAWTYEGSPAARFRARKRSSARPMGSHSLAITR